MRAILAGAARGGTAPSLRVENATKRFGGLRVFEDFSFEVPAGGVLGVIGPNGAGKTTLINVICGMLSLSSGRILLGDRDISSQPFHVVSRLGVARSFRSDAWIVDRILNSPEVDAEEHRNRLLRRGRKIDQQMDLRPGGVPAVFW